MTQILLHKLSTGKDGILRESGRWIMSHLISESDAFARKQCVNKQHPVKVIL